MKIQKVRRIQSGIAHYVIPIAIVGVIAIGGVFSVVASNANSATTKATVTKAAKMWKIQVKIINADRTKPCGTTKAYDERYSDPTAIFNVFCKKVTANNTNVYIANLDGNAKCNGESVFTLDPKTKKGKSFSTARTFSCTPYGKYYFGSENGDPLYYKQGNKIEKAHWYFTVDKSNIGSSTKKFTLGDFPPGSVGSRAEQQ